MLFDGSSSWIAAWAEYIAVMPKIYSRVVIPRSQRNGFAPRFPVLHRCYNSGVAVLLILTVLPLIAAIAMLLLATQGRSILYRGTRLGVGGRPFHILKFRTLDTKRAAELTRDKVLPSGSGIETPLGSFLRETRLDELPQLFNILLGDMNICGPRPVRPEIAALSRATVANYDQRFAVKPGLIGPSQAYLSHGTSKAMRSRFNNVLCRSPVRYRGEFAMMFMVAACVLGRTLSRLVAAVGGARTRGRSGADGLTFEPTAGHAVDVVSLDDGRLVLRDAPGAVEGRLVVTLPNGQKRFAPMSLAGTLGAAANEPPAFQYVARGALAEHVLSRYVFRRVVVPHRSQLPHTRLMRQMSRNDVAGAARAPAPPATSPMEPIGASRG